MIYFLGLGTNLGDRGENLRVAIEKLAATLEILKKSSVYESKPMGPQDQPDFLNMVIEVETDLQPLALLEFVKKVEKEMGRVKTEKWGARVIDVDILTFRTQSSELRTQFFDEENLRIPHPGMLQREFVLRPMEEIAPGLLQEVYGKSFDELLAETCYY
jgi:2-amino-4-hydroxy-6-hydroxymethyldihydropteridine diphosphokinase